MTHITDAAIIANSDALKAGWARRTWLDAWAAHQLDVADWRVAKNAISSRQRHQNLGGRRMLWFENRADGSI